uniref:Uncharacterized protein n=1 Tax=Setaria viridis TaxID=4556 RepID=A0A4U6W5K5_SETVI|nr:hypothetical protein SEVIR_1G013900v2 [Setaria viridis]
MSERQVKGGGKGQRERKVRWERERGSSCGEGDAGGEREVEGSGWGGSERISLGGGGTEGGPRMGVGGPGGGGGGEGAGLESFQRKVTPFSTNWELQLVLKVIH